MSRAYAITSALIVLVAGGLLHGLCSERWESSAALEEAAQRLQEVPGDFGEWQSRQEVSEAEDFDLAGARGYWTRTYINKRSKEGVRVILMCGRAGRMSVHTPQVCYRGAGYEMPEDAIRQVIATAGERGAGTFWTATFTK